MRSYRLISQTPAVFAACPVFKSNKNQNVFNKRVSLNPKRDDFERGNETMLRNTLSFALFISQHEALLLCLRTIRRAKRVLLSSKTTTRNKSSYLSPYAHRPDHSLTLSLSLKMTNESSLCFSFQKRANVKPYTLNSQTFLKESSNANFLKFVPVDKGRERHGERKIESERV